MQTQSSFCDENELCALNRELVVEFAVKQSFSSEFIELWFLYKVAKSGFELFLATSSSKPDNNKVHNSTHMWKTRKMLSKAIFLIETKLVFISLVYH